MSASLTTLAPLESPRSLKGSPKTVIFDSQLWLGDGQPPLICQFRYFNSNDMTFEPLGFYFLHANVSASRSYWIFIQPHSQVLKMHSSLPSHSKNLTPEDYQITGDILWVSLDSQTH